MAGLKDKEGTFNSTMNGKSKSGLKRKIGADSNNPTHEASWTEVPPDAITGLITRITHSGGAVTLGRTRDKGALTLTVLHDDFERQTFYVRPNSADGWAIFVEIYDTFAGISGLSTWE